ncbi:hypothetical protein GPECTOR_431g302 [Gonium pectorale]|uniref:ABC transporter domain-containing protein n=1 Tax=Gonium pectorale TaxID=33097 RepID=A0A150FWB3_GONPE|nr:hypothetical protein GPECTOR_431g302 [Gonium pectorale]|eukprot:KXZ41495.1 hypothetical protein GPECTOR_431g302 [Gonium pectorale]
MASNLQTIFSALPPARKRLLAVAIVAGGLGIGAQVGKLVRYAQREQAALCAEVEAARGGRGATRRSPTRIAVDKRFLRRLAVILGICVPSPLSREAMLILAQGCLLVSRTLLTDYISRVEGYCGSTLVSQQFGKFWRALSAFAAIGVPAALVNSGLKYMQKQIELAFQQRLTTFLHAQYCSNRAYYAASTLGGLTHADQRITEDVEKFAASISELYAHTFKHRYGKGSEGWAEEGAVRRVGGVGDLIMVYKRVTALASHTSRVSELLEQVARLVGEDAEHRELFRKNVSVNHFLGLSEPYHAPGEPVVPHEPPPPPKRCLGATLRFHRVALDSPDGTPLIRELSFEVVPGKRWGAAGAGEITTPDCGRVFFLSQRPYLVTGTLRDQILYPNPPRSVWRGATYEEHTHFADASGRLPPPGSPELDATLEGCLRAVELEYLLARHGWEAVHNWNEVLSGGEKQRLAMARLLYHRPQYAVLDECTSAVSADGELRLYGECLRAGVTFLSIAHRPALKRFHSTVIHFDANVSKTGRGWWSEALPDVPTASATSAPAPLLATAGSGAGTGTAGSGAASSK